MLTKQTEIELSNDQVEEIISWRRYLHQHPELSFQEYKTSAFIYETLSTFPNLEVTRPTETSVLAVLKGAYPGKTIGFRADMDALPIQEETDYFLMHPKTMVLCMLVDMMVILPSCLASQKH